MLPVGLIIISLLLLNQLIPALLAPANYVPPASDENTADAPVVANAVSDIPGEGVRLDTVGDSFADWQAMNGDWQARDGGLYHTSRGSFENFAVYSKPFNPPYVMEAVIDHVDGIGGGLLVGSQSPDSQAQSALVRFESDGSAIYWGNYDANGVFEGRGYADISIDPMAPQRLAIRNLGTSFDLLLNGQVIATEIPLDIGSGYVGIAAPDTEAAFYDLRIVTPDGVVVTEGEDVVVVDSNVDQVVVNADAVVEQTNAILDKADTISGEWIYADGAITQILPEANDYVIGLNVLGSTYRMEATITLPDDEAIDDSGGGFIIHMPDRYERAGATMVRLLAGGREVLWGQYDADGTFNGKGNIPLNLPLDEPFRMVVAVSDMTYDILINDEMIVQGLPLPVAEGWLGLTAYRGPVIFSGVQLDLDG